MPNANRGARHSRPDALASRQLEQQQPSGDLVARIVDTPHLARAVPRLPPQLLHRVIETRGLEDCAELVALATPAQLAALFDLDLWHSARPGMDEAFDAARFGVWLEVLLESGASVAAQRLAEIDAALLITALAQYVAVFDAAVASHAVEVDGEDVAIAAGLRDGLHGEIGGYMVVATRADAWDTIVAVLIALDEEQPECFDRVMHGCRRLSNSKPEVDGLDDLADASEQAWFDLAVDRERRREEQGYVTPAQARAFLQGSRQLDLGRDSAPPADPIAIACFRAVESMTAAQSEPIPASSDAATPEESHSAVDEVDAVAAIVDVLLDAGVLPEQPRALLTGAEGPAPRLAGIHAQLQVVQDADEAVYALRTQELSFLANVLVAGCSLQGRPFTTREAFDGAVAICNLGLDNWPRQWLAPASRPLVDAARTLPDDFLVDHDLATLFQVGWTVLHHRVGMFVAEQLLAVLGSLQCSDRDVQLGLNALRRALAKQTQAGVPWHARHALDVIAILDMPAWAALLALLDECPVMLANVSASGPERPLSISMSAFEFISENAQIASVQAFMSSLPDTLAQ